MQKMGVDVYGKSFARLFAIRPDMFYVFVLKN